MILKYYDFINEEMNFDIIECQYVKGNINITGNIINTFTFITNKNNSYTVYIHNTIESNHKLESGRMLQDINLDNSIPTIYFSLTNRGLNQSLFNKLANKNEYMEVMGKVIFIIRNFIIENDQYKVFSIGEVDDDKMKFYEKWLKNLPINNIEIGLSDNYNDNNGNKTKAYYLIR